MTEPMLRVEDLTVRYGSGNRALTAVDSVTLEVPRGRTLGLVGESGSGKSTVARAIVGLVRVADGRIWLDGRDHTSDKARNGTAFRRRVQMVFQDPYSSLNPRMTVESALLEAVGRRQDLGRRERAAEVRRTLELVGLGQSSLNRYPHQFSGGQRQRIAIARALAVSPEVVVMDEITSALDVSVQATILNLLKEIQRELGLSYLFIAHDLAVVGRMSDQVAVMYLGRVVERAASVELFAEPKHPYTQVLISSVPRFELERVRAPVSGDQPDPRHPPAGCRFHTRCPVGPGKRDDREICRLRDPQELADSTPHEAACHFALAAKAVA